MSFRSWHPLYTSHYLGLAIISVEGPSIMRWLEGHNSTRRERDRTLHWPWHDQHEILLQLKLDGKLTRWQCDVLIMGIIWSYSRIIFSLREQWWRRPTAAEPTMLQKWRWDNFHFLFQINLYFDFQFVHNNIAKVTVRQQLSLSLSVSIVEELSLSFLYVLYVDFYLY